MGRGRVWWLVCLAVLSASGPASALTAVIEVNEPGWYTAKKATKYGNMVLTDFYAPLPVFLEGWKSSPREDIVDYLWDFGDGSPTLRSFNGAHIYENPGTYTATLTVVDKRGETARASVTINVRARNGKTYYVDSVLGDDSNPGTSPTTAWKTATKAFAGMNSTRYKPGDRVLFKRGQTFDFAAGVCAPGHYKAGYGYYFGAYGTGPKPILKKVGTSAEPLIKIAGNDAAHWGILDLEFDATSAEGVESDVIVIRAQAMGLYFLRCDLKNFKQGIGINGRAEDTGFLISNIFIVGCTTYNSSNIHLYAVCHRYALMDNHFDLAGNHLAYLAHLVSGVITNNLFTRPPFGRRGLRISGAEGYEIPSGNVYVANNQLLGWIDPLSDSGTHAGGGTRYTWCMVEFGPNTDTDQGIEHIVFENNVVTDSEMLIKLGDCEHVIIRNNELRTLSPYGGAPRIRFGHEFEHRPLKDIRVLNNTIKTYENRNGDTPVFEIAPYTRAPYKGRSVHEDLLIQGNRVIFDQGTTRLITVPNNAAQIVHLTSNGNIVYAPGDTGLFQVGGSWNVPGALYNLAGWRSFCGNDRASLVYPAPGAPIPGIASSPATCDTGPIPVTYEGAASTNGSGLREVRLWVKKGTGGWVRTDLTSPSETGQFQYAGMNGNGTYYFAVQATDNTGASSPAPTGTGHTDTVFNDVSPADTTSPTAGTASAPAMAVAAPIVVSYSGASDAGGSGLKAVHLWVRKDGGAWADTGLTQGSAAGSFQYTPPGDGSYAFALQAEDYAGNLSPAPSGTGNVTTIFDTTPPLAGTLTAPAATNASPVVLDYSGAADNGSGLQSVRLWVKKGTGAWADSGLGAAAPSGTFSFVPPGNGTYAFVLVATDRAGLSSGAPSGTGAASTVFDTTAPSPGVLSAPATAERRPITLSYSGVQDAGSGIKAVYLWARKGAAGAWSRTSLLGTEGSGTFAFSDITGNDTYYFAVQAEDHAGNLSPAPSGDGGAHTVYEAVFTAGQAASPAYATSAPITVTYSGASDSESGLRQVRLWYKKGEGGVWADSGAVSSGASGAFSFSPSEDDTYYFAVQAESKSGAVTTAPSGAGDTVTVYDTTPPVPGVPALPSITNASPIVVAFDGASDGGSGIGTVALWARKDDGAWTDTGLSQTAASGTFSYTPSGDGTYRFALVATDKVGLRSDEPTGEGQARTDYDTTPPVLGTLEAPAETALTPIEVAYSGVEDALTGLKSVTLWAKKGATGTWTPTSASFAESAGTFLYSAVTGNDTYYFALQAEDHAGNRTPDPSGVGAASTAFAVADGELHAGHASAPAYAKDAPIVVTYAGASGGSSDLKAVHLWYKKGVMGVWARSGLSATGTSGSFDFNPTGDGTYYFALQAENVGGETSPQPTSSGDAATLFDTVPPTTALASVPPRTKNPTVSVIYAGASDSGSGVRGVRLWVRQNGGAWTDTGMSADSASGSFSYTFPEDGTYAFALVTTDRAGHTSPEPSGAGAASITFDSTAPTGGVLTAPATANREPIALNYTGVSDGGVGIKAVHLWVRKGANGAWTRTGLASGGGAGSFAFADASGTDTYYFAIQAEDLLGNIGPEPSGDGHAYTDYARILSAGTVSVAPYSRTAPIHVAYSGASDSGNGLRNVYLWYKKGESGVWTHSGLSSAGASGSFSFTAIDGDDTYYFATQAENNEGTRTDPPTGSGGASTIYDTTPPDPGTASAPRSARKLPISIHYSGVRDDGSGIKQVMLWMKETKGGNWIDTGLRSTSAPDGRFELNSLGRDSRYIFYVQAEDKAGIKSPAPMEVAVTAP